MLTRRICLTRGTNWRKEPAMAPVERILAKLPDAKRSGNGWTARCPGHDDQRPSLSISEGEDGRVLLHCHAGCAVDAICAAVGVTLRDLMPAAYLLPRSQNSQKATLPPPKGVS